MGIFGPTKKGGGLDMRFKSNSGGYLGKTASLVSGLSALASTSSQENNTPDSSLEAFFMFTKTSCCF